jgi:hypothetical protein
VQPPFATGSSSGQMQRPVPLLQRVEIERDGPLRPSSLSIVTGNENPWLFSDIVKSLPNVLGNDICWPIKHLGSWRAGVAKLDSVAGNAWQRLGNAWS